MRNRLLIRETQALISIAAKMIRNTMGDRLEKQDTGITTLQHGILRTIEHRPETISVISKKQMLDPSTLVPAVDALERNGFVRRTKDPKDRRRTPIEITDKGLALLVGLPMLDDSDDLVKAMAQISDEHQQELVDRLQELVAKLTSEAEVQALIAALQSERK